MPRLLASVALLTAVHASVGFGAAACVEHGWHARPAQVVFDAVCFADAGLLGVWAGLGRHSKAAGFIGAGLGLIYLGALAAVGLRPSLAGRISPVDDIYVVVWVWLLLLALALATIATIVAASMVLRKKDIRLARLGTQDGANFETLQFSILQLMILVFVIAILVKLGPFAQTYLNDYHSYLSSLVAVVTGGLSFGGVAMVAAWAALATRRPGAWSLVAIVLSAAIGLLPPYYFPRFLTDDFVATSATTALEATFVAGTLLVMRRFGFRLVRGARGAGF
ncbi:MAG TPA: hypothetical protein VGX76_07040 [Pirellulales bacterium]|jgi:hypothetical protein|nr:hypothetical protein [Pirellulales bacterium]